MKAFVYASMICLLACAPSEDTVHQATANVDMASVPAFLEALSEKMDGGIDVASLVALTDSIALDEEQQDKLEVRYKGEDTTLVYHVWREQADWVHLYLSTPSEGLVEEVKAQLEAFERSGGG